MQLLVHKWLNGKKEYYTGVALMQMCNADAALCKMLNKGPNDLNRKRVLEWLQSFIKTSSNGKATTKALLSNTNLVGQSKNPILVKSERQVHAKDENHSSSSSSLKQDNGTSTHTNPTNDSREQRAIIAPGPHAESTLYLACKLEADNAYKALMNKRAVLFASVSSLQPYEDANTPDKVEQRRKPSIEIALEYQYVSKLYDRADFVMLHGKLPDVWNKNDEVVADGIPDILLRQSITNLQKNISKLKAREQTPARIALIESHEKTLSQLQARWELLKA